MLILRLLLFPALIFFISLGFLAAGLFEIWPWLDIPLHIMGGFSIGVSGHLLLAELEARHLLKIRRLWLRVLIILSLVALMAVLWEVYEFMLDLVFGTGTQLGLPDTVTDQMLGLAGGALSLVWFWCRRRIT